GGGMIDPSPVRGDEPEGPPLTRRREPPGPPRFPRGGEGNDRSLIDPNPRRGPLDPGGGMIDPSPVRGDEPEGPPLTRRREPPGPPRFPRGGEGNDRSLIDPNPRRGPLDPGGGMIDPSPVRGDEPEGPPLTRRREPP